MFISLAKGVIGLGIRTVIARVKLVLMILYLTELLKGIQEVIITVNYAIKNVILANIFLIIAHSVMGK